MMVLPEGIRIERFQNRVIVIDRETRLLGVALHNTDPTLDILETDLNLNLSRIFQRVPAFFMNTYQNPFPFEISRNLQPGDRLEIVNQSLTDFVAIFQDRKGPDMYAEGLLFSGDVATVQVPSGIYILHTLIGMERDASNTFHPSAFQTKVYVDGKKIMEGPMHALMSRPGYVRIMRVPIYQNLTVEVATGSSTSKPQVVAVFKRIHARTYEKEHETRPDHHRTEAVVR
ncbi:MAG: hypothetical protein L3J76_04180 [Candidatus Hydrothermae bacterium]|nr:hypothetical protein [Candidatus Hydrothermae bacterium]